MSPTALAYSAYTWPGLLKHLRQMLIANARMEEGEYSTLTHTKTCSLEKVFQPLTDQTMLLFLGIDWKVHVPSNRAESIRNTRMGFNRSLSNVLILRGKDVSSADAGKYTGCLIPSFGYSVCRTIVVPFIMGLFGSEAWRAVFWWTGAFKEPGLYVPWLPADAAFHMWHSPVPFSGYEKLATLISNSQSLLNPLDNMVRKAWNMFASR